MANVSFLSAASLVYGQTPPKDEGTNLIQRKVLHMGEITIEGKIRKPTAFYILQRSRLILDSTALTKSFLPRIYQAVEKSPF